jgi:VWFA-related protein
MRLKVIRAFIPGVLTFALVLGLAIQLLSAQSPAPAPPPPQQPTQSQQAPQPQQAPGGYAITVNVPVVNVDVVVTDNNGNYLGGLKKENFRVLEDGAPQTIQNFESGTGPFTMVMLVEYSKIGYGYFLYNARNWASLFLRNIQPNDWIALASFDTRPHIEVDFTHDPREIEQGLYQMNLPFFSESNLFDALVDTLDRMHEVKGRKAILVLASGIDTFSRLTLNKVLDRLKENDVTIFCVGVAEPMFNQSIDGGGLTYLQAQNQLRTFANMSGGRAWFPRFDQDVPGIMSDVAASLRNQYSLAYTPTSNPNDGKFHKIKVELVDQAGKPLVTTDQKGKKIDMHVYARQGYQAPQGNVQ